MKYKVAMVFDHRNFLTSPMGHLETFSFLKKTVFQGGPASGWWWRPEGGRNGHIPNSRAHQTTCEEHKMVKLWNWNSGSSLPQIGMDRQTAWIHICYRAKQTSCTNVYRLRLAFTDGGFSSFGSHLWNNYRGRLVGGQEAQIIGCQLQLCSIKYSWCEGVGRTSKPKKPNDATNQAICPSDCPMGEQEKIETSTRLEG